jgi:hypothetical protein
MRNNQDSDSGEDSELTMTRRGAMHSGVLGLFGIDIDEMLDLGGVAEDTITVTGPNGNVIAEDVSTIELASTLFALKKQEKENGHVQIDTKPEEIAQELAGTEISPAQVGTQDDPVDEAVANSVSAGNEEITESVVRAYLNDQTYRDYVISEYADVGEAATAAMAAQNVGGDYGKAGGDTKIAPGFFEVENTAKIEDGSVLKGSGVRSTALEAPSGASGYPLVKYGPTDDGNYFAGLEDLRIDGNNEDVKGFVSDGSGTQNVNDMHFYRLIFRDLGDRAIDLDQGWGYRFEDVLVEGCSEGKTHCVQSKGTEQYWRDAFIAYNKSTYSFTTWGGDAAQKKLSGLSVYQNEQNGVLVRKANNKFVAPSICGNGHASTGSYDGMLVSSTGLRDATGTKIVGGTFDGRDTSTATNVTDVGLRMNSDDCIVNGTEFKNHVSEDIVIDASNCVVTGVIAHGDITLTSNASDCVVSGRVKGTVSDNGTNNDTEGVV